MLSILGIILLVLLCLAGGAVLATVCIMNYLCDGFWKDLTNGRKK